MTLATTTGFPHSEVAATSAVGIANSDRSTYHRSRTAHVDASAAVLPGTPHAEQPRVDGLPLESGRICGIGMGLVWPEAKLVYSAC